MKHYIKAQQRTNQKTTPSYFGVTISQVGYRVIFIELQGHRGARRAATATVQTSSFPASFAYFCDFGLRHDDRVAKKVSGEEDQGGHPALGAMQAP